jgi:hypothetical protein
MVDNETLERWGFSLDRHRHYSPPTQAAVHAFQQAFATWQSLYKTDWTAAVQWSDRAQEAWNRLVKCRREETGHTMYLTPEQYEEARREHAG